MEINQLNDTIMELEIKHNEVKTENKMLRRWIEQQRELLKAMFKFFVKCQNCIMYLVQSYPPGCKKSAGPI